MQEFTPREQTLFYFDSIEKGAGWVGRGGGEGVQSKENGRVASTKSAYSAIPTV